MPTPIPPGLRLGIIEPRDAIAAFQRRRLLQPSFRWQDVWQEEHARAMAVAGVQRLDVLQAFQDEIELSIAEGRSLADFRDRMRSQLVKRGYWGDVEVTDPDTGETRVTRFNDRRLALIFDVNTRQAQAAGRWARIERNKARMPFVMYRTMRDERVRASHRPWDGVVLPVDHTWWHTHFPPCGWRCRCTAFGIDEAGIERLRKSGLPVKREPPEDHWVTYVNPRSGEVVPVPHGIDPGFAYNPGKQRDAAFFDQALNKSLKASPLAGASAVAQATIDHPAMVAQATQRFGAFVDRTLASGRAGGELEFVGALKPAAVRALATHDIEPPGSAAIAVRDWDVLHALRRSKGAAAVPAGVYRRLPELLARADAMLLEKGDKPALLYVVDLLREDGSVAKLVLQLDTMTDARVEGARAAVRLNLLRTATVMDPNALRDRTRYELLWGAL